MLSNGTIKYAFLDYDNKKIMSGTEYMKWDRGKGWKNPTEYFDQEDIDICIKNIKEINKMAKKMTADEVKEFMEMDYSYLIEK